MDNIFFENNRVLMQDYQKIQPTSEILNTAFIARRKTSFVPANDSKFKFGKKNK